jgi:hypothetical protein
MRAWGYERPSWKGQLDRALNFYADRGISDLEFPLGQPLVVLASRELSGFHGSRANRKVLILRLLGEIEVVRSGECLTLPPSKRTRGLLAYLAVTGRRHRRDRLCSMLWEVPDDPRGALRWSQAARAGG